MLPVFNQLQVLFQLHLCIEKAVLVNVFLIFDLMLIRELGSGSLMLLFQFSHALTVLFLGQDFFFFAACDYCLVVVLIIVGLQIILCIGDETGNLVFVLGFHGTGFFKLCSQPGQFCFFFLFCINVIPFYAVNVILEFHYFCGSVFSQTVQLGLDLSYIILNRPAQLYRPDAAAQGQTLDEIIRSAIWQAVSANNGNQTAAARQLGISRTTMWRYLKQEDKSAKAAGKRAEQ